MGLHNTAHYLKSKGRGQDTELVHMSKREVKGLQALALAHGGSLTINPETGLPEAFFLERVLPLVIGAGLTVASGGALTPLMAAGITGAGYGLATGSAEKGIMAGLGAYGGAGLAGSLSSMGAEAARTAGGQAATKGFETTAQEAVKSGLPDATAAQGFITPQNFPGLTPAQLQTSQASVPDLISGGSSPSQIMSSLGRASAAQATPAGVTTGNIATGLKEVGTSLPAATNFAKSNIGVIGGAALPFLTSSNQQRAPAGYQEDEYDRYLKGYKLSPDYQAYEAPRPNPYYQAQYPTYAAEGGVMKLQSGGPVERMGQMNAAINPQGGLYPQGMIDKTQYSLPTQRPTSMEVLEAGPQRMFAEGGIARYRNKGQVNVLQDYIDRQERQMSPLPRTPGMPDGGIYRDTDVDTARKDALTAAMIRLGKVGKGAGIKTSALPKTSIKGLGDISGATRDVTEAAKGGVMSHLGGYSDGGRMLKGPGDGMSDSIPATISGKQPARLADGEFVVPADVVSHLGNGSTDAGAKKLYGMMDKIRKARTGRKKQAPAVKASKYMPA